MSSMADWIDLGNPFPRLVPNCYTPITWPKGNVIQLPLAITAEEIQESVINILLRRRTRRQFSNLSMDMLGSLLWVCCHTQELGSDHLGFPLSRHPCPSGGAIHPVHLLVLLPQDNCWYRYDPTEHALHETPSKLDSTTVKSSMQALISAPSATLFLLAAEPGMTAAKYEASASLVWRDAGVMLGVLAIAAEALDLSFCPLGVTGEPWVSQLLEQPGLFGVGCAFVGTTPSS